MVFKACRGNHITISSNKFTIDIIRVLKIHYVVNPNMLYHFESRDLNFFSGIKTKIFCGSRCDTDNRYFLSVLVSQVMAINDE
jgi:hypothetical protein